MKKRRPVDVARGFLLISHPLPVLFHTIGVTLFALLAAWPHFPWGIIVLVIAAHTAMQFSIAILNDYCDRHADAVGKPTKPIPLGLVRPREALVAGLLMIVIMLLLLLPLNRAALLLSCLYLILGQAYNLGLKSTPLSGVLFAVAIPLIPLYAFASLNRVLPVLFWLVPAGALLGVALNLANSLPDIEEDARQRARTLAVVLGVHRSFFACPLLIAFCALLIGSLTLTRLVPARGWIILATLALTGLALVSMLFMFSPEQPVRMRLPYFYLVTVTCIVLAGGWLIGAIL